MNKKSDLHELKIFRFRINKENDTNNSRNRKKTWYNEILPAV